MTQNQDFLKFEKKLWEKGINYVAGVDEAGRGPLAGPVVAAAVIAPNTIPIDGVNDSKKLSAKKREMLFDLIQNGMLAYGIGIVSEKEIDDLNIHQAALKAMSIAIQKLSITPEHVLIDGPAVPNIECQCTGIIGGDAICYSIAAASILAKVERDRIMKSYDTIYPQYGFAKHKGYGTKAHRAAIQKYGRCPIHRRSFQFKPV